MAMTALMTGATDSALVKIPKETLYIFNDLTCASLQAKAGFFRVSFSSQLMAAAAAAFAHAAGMPVDWTDSTSTVLVIHLVVLSIGIAHVHYYVSFASFFVSQIKHDVQNVMNDKLVPDMKRPGSVCSVGYGRS